MDNFNQQYDSIGAPADSGAPSADIGAGTSSPATENIPDGSLAPAPADANPINAEFLAEFDDIGRELGDDAPAAGASAANAPDETAAASDSLPPTSGAAPTSGAESSQGKKEEESASDATETGQEETDETAANAAAAPVNDQVTAEDEAYIKANLPEREWEKARKAFKNARMAVTFLNPNVPAGQWLDNLAQKSASRFSEVETEVIRRSASGDPVEFLGRIFESTQNEEGNSSVYTNLLESLVTTNTDFVLEVLKSKGLTLSEAKEVTGAENNAPESANDLSDDEIEEILGSPAFGDLAETYPEEAGKWQKLLAAQKEKNSRLRELESEKEKSESIQQTEQEKEAAQKQQEAQASAQRAVIQTFESVYQETVTKKVDTELDTKYGLRVSDEERQRNPVIAYLKDAKRRLILAGGLEGSGDFDNDLYEWGQNRPAFKDAATAAVRFSRAGEKENAAQSAAELADFADMFLSERMKLPDIQMIDEIIQAVTRDQQSRNRTRLETPSGDFQGARSGGGGKNLLSEIDAL